VRRLDDDELVSLFCGHWLRTRDQRACLRLIVDADRRGQAPALARAGADVRQIVAQNVVERAEAVERAMPILKRFSRATGVKLRAIFARKGPKTVARRRYEAMWLLRELGEMSFPEIGLAVGGRGHSHAIVGVKKTAARIAEDPELRTRLLSLVQPEGRTAV
jgi:chromosomal replication initiation ATPase DnaA